MQFYLQTTDGNPSYIFDLWQILPNLLPEEFLDADRIHERQALFQKSLQNLMAKKNFDLIVQLKRGSQNNFYFKIVDSIFWFVSS